MQILLEDETYRLEFERIQGKWWTGLIEKSTGMCWTLINSNPKKDAIKMLDGMTLPEVRDAMERWKVQPQKTYKAQGGAK
tara:strand:+ start:2532 stop:2771 length:240 start_codon:yes stop_codon:yes gene_type:complete